MTKVMLFAAASVCAAVGLAAPAGAQVYTDRQLRQSINRGVPLLQRSGAGFLAVMGKVCCSTSRRGSRTASRSSSLWQPRHGPSPRWAWPSLLRRRPPGSSATPEGNNGPSVNGGACRTRTPPFRREDPDG